MCYHSQTAEPSVLIIRQVIDPYGPCGNHTTDDKPFLHKQGGFYYLSWGCFYGMSKSVYGPYQTKGSVIDTALIDPSFRTNHTATPWFRSEAIQLD